MASRRVVGRLEAALAALLFAWVLGAGLLLVLIGPHVRSALDASGHPLPPLSRWIFSAAWWPAWFGLLIVCAATSVAAQAPGVRRGALAAGLVLGALAFALYGRAVYADLDLRPLFEEGNPLKRTIDAEPPPQRQL